MKNIRFAAWLLILMLAAPGAGAAANKTKAPAQPHPERGARDMADGQIKTVTCKGRAMSMTFDDSEEILHLHTNNYFKVSFSAINYTPKGTMNPCKQAKGMYARVYYYDLKGHPNEGELISVEFRK